MDPASARPRSLGPRLDLNLAPQLVQELTDSFHFFDQNGDGRISQEELGAVVRSLGQKVSDGEIEQLMREVDANGDGFIDFQEFMDLNTRAMVSSPRPVGAASATAAAGDVDVDAAMLLSAFNVFDVDKNGFISAEELHGVLVGFGDDTVALEDCRRMIQCVDDDGDGMVNFLEFKALMNWGSFLF